MTKTSNHRLMALTRSQLFRRFLSSPLFSSQSLACTASASAFSPDTSANDKPCVVPLTTLFVSGLNKRTTSEKLQEAFAKFGEVENVKVVTDRVTGYSKGFGFVRYSTLEDAEKGIKGMDGQFLDGWVIFAEYARPKAPPGQSVSHEAYSSTR